MEREGIGSSECCVVYYSALVERDGKARIQLYDEVFKVMIRLLVDEESPLLTYLDAVHIRCEERSSAAHDSEVVLYM